MINIRIPVMHCHNGVVHSVAKVSRKFLDEWMDNPDVDGWYIGQVADLSSGC